MPWRNIIDNTCIFYIRLIAASFMLGRLFATLALRGIVSFDFTICEKRFDAILFEQGVSLLWLVVPFPAPWALWLDLTYYRKYLSPLHGNHGVNTMKWNHMLCSGMKRA